MNNKELLFDNGDGTFTQKYIYKYSVSDTSFKGILFRCLKICLCIALVVLIFRLFVNQDSLTFTQILNYIADCPNYYQDTLGHFLQTVSFEDNGKWGDILGLGKLVNFLKNVFNVLVYVFGSLYSCIMYFVYLLGILFI